MLDRRTTKKSLGVTLIGFFITVFVFAFITYIGHYVFGQEWILLYQGEGDPLMHNFFEICIPLFIGAYIAQIFDYNPS